ncbi:helix-turn-helix domain-containing protein [Methylobacterium nodulans]|uniref:helix-turn-helix domain-containing protein n=1 Tax=Methylobacterium nodulans TaxID=114616 RepID=UPI000A003D25|nr:helix-turn-helix domain-containing protein [Methylobacterium nodulans]
MSRRYVSNREAGSGAVSVDEAAEYLRISRASIWRLLKRGELPRVRIGGRTVIRRIDLDAFLAKAVQVA